MTFDEAFIQLAERTREIEITVYGRQSGKPSRRPIWIITVGGKVYVRSGQGLTREWPQNLLARPQAIVHIEGRDVPVTARHVTGAEEARSLHSVVKAKYNSERPSSRGEEPLLPSEEAAFELLPITGEAQSQ